MFYCAARSVCARGTHAYQGFVASGGARIVHAGISTHAHGLTMHN